MISNNISIYVNIFECGLLSGGRAKPDLYIIKFLPTAPLNYSTDIYVII